MLPMMWMICRDTSAKDGDKAQVLRSRSPAWRLRCYEGDPEITRWKTIYAPSICFAMFQEIVDGDGSEADIGY